MRQLAAHRPSYPGLGSHPDESLSGPDGEQLWGSYVENHMPAAWRLWWFYGPDEDAITLVTVDPHRD